MAEATTANKLKSNKSAPASFEMPTFSMPTFDLPKFDMPKMEVPAAFRDMAEKSISQAKDNYEKMKAVAEEATDVLEDTYATASKGFTDYGMKMIDIARANTNAVFDFATDLFTVKSAAEAIELSTAHARRQFEAMTSQSKELAALAQKIATDTAEPMKEGVTKAFKKVG